MLYYSFNNKNNSNRVSGVSAKMTNRNKAVTMIHAEERIDVKIALIEMWLLFETETLERQVLVEKQSELKKLLKPQEDDPDIVAAIALSLQKLPSLDEELALSLARSEESAAEEGLHLQGGCGRSDEVLALSLARSEESAVEEGFHLRGAAGGGRSRSLSTDSDFDQRLLDNLTVFDRRFQERSDVAKAAERRAQLNAALPGKNRANLEKKLDGRR